MKKLYLRSCDQGCDLFITPEFALTGYPPSDLLLRSDFHENIEIYKNKILEITINKKTIFSLSIPNKKKNL